MLARAIADAAPEADLAEVGDAGLVLLYRLLFLLYAEDRNLLPVNDRRYDDCSLRGHVREDVGRRNDQNDAFSTTASRYWAVVEDLDRLSAIPWRPVRRRANGATSTTATCRCSGSA
jgi:hypothetical protein